MRITLDTTPDQDLLLTRLNLQSNPDGRTPVEVFAPSYLSGLLDAGVKGQVQDQRSTIAAKIATADPTKLAAISAAVDAAS